MKSLLKRIDITPTPAIITGNWRTVRDWLQQESRIEPKLEKAKAWLERNGGENETQRIHKEI